MLPTVVESVFNAARTGNLAALKVSPCPTLGMLLFRVFFFCNLCFAALQTLPLRHELARAYRVTDGNNV